MGKEVCFGRWAGSLVYVTRERLDTYAAYIELLALLQTASSWDEVLAVCPVEELERSWGRQLDIWWRNQFPDAEDDRPPFGLPGLEHVSVSSLFESGYIDHLDDSAADPELPVEVSELANFRVASPVTGYEPYEWEPSTVGALEAAAERLGLRVTDESKFIEYLTGKLW